MQSSTDSPPATPTQTGGDIADGKVYVNNGFWDTYRTVWAGYAMFDPAQAGELVDGFVQQYRDGGWIARWSSPGYANLMTGTSSDVAFADAYVKGVKGFNARDAYAAAVRNATVEPPGDDPNDPSVGRKGLETSLFLGYTPSVVSEGVSWALEGYINDFGIGNMAKALAGEASGADKRRLREESEYFLSRATNYVNMFDPAIGFFQGRSASGRWKSSPDDYDPRVWGHEHDYTETDGWNFAFHVPQDGQGLANLYGGRTRARAQARRLLRHAGDRDVHGLLRRDDPRDARGPRRAHGPVGLLEPGVAPHPVDVRVRQAAVEDRGEDARGAAPPLLRLRDRPGLRRRRGQR